MMRPMGDMDMAELLLCMLPRPAYTGKVSPLSTLWNMFLTGT